MNQSQEARAGNIMPGVGRSKWRGAEVQTYTCAVRKTVTTVHTELLYNFRMNINTASYQHVLEP